MKKATVLLVILCLSIATQARQPEQKDTIRLQPLPEFISDLEDEFEEIDSEFLLLDSTRVGIGGEDFSLIPASELYTVWSNAITNPYRIPVDSIIAQGDTLSIALNNFTYPLLTHYRVNSEYGKRGRRFHNGIDLKVNTGDTVVSSMPGMVRFAKYSGPYGNLVIVRHHNGLETYYAHLSKILVKPDQIVESGETIGLGGSTGRSTGPHLHYEIRYLGKTINPRHVIDFDSTLNVKNDTLLLTAKHFGHQIRYASTSSSTTATAAKIDGNGTWVVKSGDTLSRIAQRTGKTIGYLCNVNGISRNGTLRIGQKIKY